MLYFLYFSVGLRSLALETLLGPLTQDSENFFSISRENGLDLDATAHLNMLLNAFFRARDFEAAERLLQVLLLRIRVGFYK